MSESDDTLSYSEAKQLLDDLLARSARDAEFRRLCLADGREAVKVSMGREMPDDVSVHFVEHQGQGAGIILPPFEAEVPAATPATEAASENKPAAAPRGLNIRPKQG
jgi:hypothetical protein